ncbi:MULTISPECIES: hypothetical protein [Nonomuraea]|uniref:Secreted protein n=1 Tax=Nonomuraea salmonea TaxID=46181 RepID=A0ABV5NR32_9ACTN
MHRFRAPLAALLLACAACSTTVECTAIGTPVGVSLAVRAPLAARAQEADLEVCWDGSCRRARAELFPTTRAGEQTCSGDTCSVTAVPTGDKHGFGGVAGLPARPVEVRLTLRDAQAKPLLERTVRATPKERFPNGPQCGAGGPNTTVTVMPDGSVRTET